MKQLQENILEFYKKTSIYTNYGPYKKYFCSLPDDLNELTKLINNQYIHRKVLYKAYLENNKLKEEYPWYKYRLHDDILLTAPAITAELFRLESQGFTMERENKHKVIITCRYASVLLSSILKAKGYAARVRSGFSTLIFENENIDHWVVEYFNEEKRKWIMIDADILDSNIIKNYNNTNVSKKEFYTAAQAWLDVRSGKADCDIFVHGSHLKGLNMLARTLFFDFHALMNDEISYLFFPTYISEDDEFFNLSIDDLKELDDLAELMLSPDKNFDELRYIFRNDKKFRAINTPLLSDRDHLELKENA